MSIAPPPVVKEKVLPKPGTPANVPLLQKNKVTLRAKNIPPPVIEPKTTDTPSAGANVTRIQQQTVKKNIMLDSLNEKAVTLKSVQLEMRENQQYSIATAKESEWPEVPDRSYAVASESIQEFPQPEEYIAIEPVGEEAVGSTELSYESIESSAKAIESEQFPSLPLPAAAGHEANPEPIDPEGIALIKAVQEQLAELEPAPAVEVERLFTEIALILATSTPANISTEEGVTGEVAGEPEANGETWSAAVAPEPGTLTEVTADTRVILEAAIGTSAEPKAEEMQPRLVAAVTQLFELLGMEEDQSQVKKLVLALMERKDVLNLLVQEHPAERGTHEILQYLDSMAQDIEQVLEPIHALLGRIVLAGHTRQSRLAAA